MSESKIKAGKNGCASEVIFFGRKIYQDDCEYGDLGTAVVGGDSLWQRVGAVGEAENRLVGRGCAVIDLLRAVGGHLLVEVAAHDE